MAQVECPSCKSKEFFYVQRVVEYHTMESPPDEDGNADLLHMHEDLTRTDDDFEPYLKCYGCGAKYNVQMEIQK